MEGMVVNRDFWKEKRVFLTGHTGFKGSWLSLWLQDMGAKVYGYALDPPTEPNLFTIAQVSKGMAQSTIADIRNEQYLKNDLQGVQPEIVIHMAAQSLVRYSYLKPVDTYAVNVIGTINLLEAIRSTPGIRAVLIVTSDKCYENREWFWGYRENEPLGGRDPYSSSKACAEIVTAAWRRSYLSEGDIPLASVRAGNVIGGGDWGRDRLIPDFLHALDNEQTLEVRYPTAIRPWQYVFEPLAGYLLLAEQLYLAGADYAEAWNFGPNEHDCRTVKFIVEYLCSTVPGIAWQSEKSSHPEEALYLKLDSSKARSRLGWLPKWGVKTALDKTVEWHYAWKSGSNMQEVSLKQLYTYETDERPK